jgi:hypothetical protein
MLPHHADAKPHQPVFSTPKTPSKKGQEHLFRVLHADF